MRVGIIAYAKANPGRLNYGSPGIGSSVHLAAEMFQRMTATEMVHIGYRGSGPALQALAAGEVDLIFDNITAAIGLVRAGQIVGLAVTSAGRWPLAPEFPTVGETVPGYEVTSFHGIGVRAGTPAEIATRIERDVMALSREPAIRERLAVIGAEAVGSSAAEFAQLLAQERIRWGRVIRELRIRVN